MEACVTMIRFLASLPTFDEDEATKLVWRRLESAIPSDVEGVCYYKHPVLRLVDGVTADLTLLTPEFDPIAVRCLDYRIDDVLDITKDEWTVDGTVIESPLLALEDFVTILDTRFRKDRALRDRLRPLAILALPLISHAEFQAKFGDVLDRMRVLWAGTDFAAILPAKLNVHLSPDEWKRARSIFQGASPLTRSGSGQLGSIAKDLGSAIRHLDREIALLDNEQEKAALQIAPGPQCIRGLAGTGKTVLLAMKAANIHLHYPERKILFTFHTQSLYNQTKALITKFYRFYSDTDPDWDFLHVRHAWGGRTREGVYSELCARHGQRPLTFDEAKARNWKLPFQACCEHALTFEIQPYYDFILVDEAQDFPQHFFPVLYRLGVTQPQTEGRPQPRIVWAYDELQNLTNIDKNMRPENLFGGDANNIPLVSLDGPDYPGQIEKELILRKSYRCAQNVLMVAHGIGLGLYNQVGGCVQMLDDTASWNAIGYEVESGELKKGERIVLYRDPENSPNRIGQIYQGGQPFIVTKTFNERNDELQWIAESIKDDIVQGVQPDQIIVIFLDPRLAKEPLAALQGKLLEQFELPSTIPGLINNASEYMEKGKITLSAVFRAKGNEAYVVYVCGFDSLYDYVEAIDNRNRAFTAITRSKAWVRISGVGQNNALAEKEIRQILNDIPRFRFTFPDMETIKRLDAETTKRRRSLDKAKSQISDLLHLDLRALAAVNSETLNELLRRIEEARDANKRS